MALEDKALLFAHPRSGSSNLYEILQLNPHLNIIEEPFNENYIHWEPGNKNYRERVHDVPSLDAQLAEMFTTYNGIKVLDYQLPDSLLDHLLTRPDFRVVFIHRRNVLQAVVSGLIAEQTGLWKKWDMTEPLESYYKNLRSLDIHEVRSRVAALAAHMDHCESVVDRRADHRVFKIVYEDFFFAPFYRQTEEVRALWRFLGLPPIPTEHLTYYLRPESTKLNSASTYALLPNAAEVNASCGSDTHGWLFPPE